MKPYKILLVGNSIEFRFSMKLFPEMLLRGMQARGVAAELILPWNLFGRLAPWAGPFGKWLFYLDKYALFPLRLKALLWCRRREVLVVHVCDHSNAMYTQHLRRVPHLVNCHDLIAPKSALGESPRHRTTWTGRLLQNYILKGLNRAALAVCISRATQNDLLRLTTLPAARTRVIYMGQNELYAPLAPAQARSRVQALTGSFAPYFFHVSGNAWYKNRLGVLKIYAAVSELLGRKSPRLLLAGEPLDSEMEKYLHDHPGLREQVRYVGSTGFGELRALYSAASLFLFPSWDEGFGWPIIEAQACGTPVAVSDLPVLREVAGSAAVFHDPADALGFAEKIVTFLQEGDRASLVQAGYENVQRFDAEEMVSEYLALYQELAGT